MQQRGPGEPLVRPVIIDGKLLEPLPSAKAIRDSASARVAALPAGLRQLEEGARVPGAH